jgi:DNA polymerase III alpha subunit
LRLKEIGAEYAPITDRASTFGWTRWGKVCKAHDLKPVFGVEIGVTPSLNETRPTVDHWTFIAKDSVKPLNDLLALATQQFRYQPLLTIPQAFAAAKQCYVAMGKAPQIDWEMPKKKRGGVMLTLSPSSSPVVIRKALANGWPLVAASDNRFPRSEDAEFYQILCGRAAETQTYPQYILSEKEWLEAIPEADPKAVKASQVLAREILKKSTAKLLRASLPSPERPASLEVLCKRGAKKLGCDLTRKVYKERLARELKLIREKGYEDYFYIVSDLCRWARGIMIVGPARGSSCGSLVCYLLGITTIDPIPHGLIFERFIDVNRNDMPDIDIDFSDQQRHLVFDYLGKTYGFEKVARLGTVANYHPRSALKEVGAALQLPFNLTNNVADTLIIRSSGDARALDTLEDSLKGTPSGRKLLEEHPEAIIATRFEGHPRHYSQHAAGVVIASEPITTYVATDHRTNATMCDKKDAEEGFNLLKIDALGLTQLSVFEDCLELAGLPEDYLETVPLDDPEAFRILNERRYSGIFQFNGMALQGLSRVIKIGSFNDIVSLTALARPGPINSGGANEWTLRHNGHSPITYPHKLFEPFLKDTLGIVIYQEQVMEIGRQIGDLNWEQVTALRRAMSKSLGKEYFDQFGDPWKKAAIKKGVAPKDAEKVWDDLCAYGSWSFNKSHSVAYGLISYWCAHLKARFPFEFAAASLTHEADTDRQLQTLREMVTEGFRYLPYDKDASGTKWSITEKEGQRLLVGPLSVIHGIGPKSVIQILESRENGKELTSRIKKLLAEGKTSIDSLYPIADTFNRLIPDPAAASIFTTPTRIAHITYELSGKTVVVFCVVAKIDPMDENEPARVARRGYVKKGLTAALGMRLKDDTDSIYAKVSPKDYEKIGKEIVERGKAGQALYVIKGEVWVPNSGENSFKMIKVSRIRYVGDLGKDPGDLAEEIQDTIKEIKSEEVAEEVEEEVA